MKFRFIILPISFILFGVSCAFAEINISASLDKISLTTEETLTYKLTVTSSERQLPGPQVVEFKDFVVLSQAQSSTISFVKNSAKTILVYAFILAPTKAGKFKIGPSSIKIKNKVYSTEGFDVEVKEGKARPGSEQRFPIPGREIPPGQKPQQSYPEDNQTESEEMPQFIL